MEGIARYEAGLEGSSQIMKVFVRSEDLLLGEMEHPGGFYKRRVTSHCILDRSLLTVENGYLEVGVLVRGYCGNQRELVESGL